MDIHADRIYGHIGYDVTSYFRSAFVKVRKTAENAASDGFWSIFSGTAYGLPHQLVGLLFMTIGALTNKFTLHYMCCLPEVGGGHSLVSDTCYHLFRKRSCTTVNRGNNMTPAINVGLLQRSIMETRV